MHHRRLALLGSVGVVMTLIVSCSSAGGGGGGSSTRAAEAAQDPNDMTMVNVVKMKGISWFDRMAVGDENFAKRTGVDTRQEGADDTSPEKQIQIIKDLIPQEPTAITVIAIETSISRRTLAMTPAASASGAGSGLAEPRCIEAMISAGPA